MMNTENYNVVGVMSGTSLDGIDMAHLNFTESDDRWEFEILEAETVAYPPHLLQSLKNAIVLPPAELSKLDLDYTLFLSKTICEFILKHKLTGIDAVCSHGHTVIHRPADGLTLQIGNLPEIKTHIKPTVVCDFRVQDVKLGGQGAPLVPIGDRILFSDYKYCLNLGGFSNVSFEENERRIAFDISPVNTVLNHYANLLGLDYDDGGRIAEMGKIDSDLLDDLNNNQYYGQRYPKSLGMEFVLSEMIPLIDSFDIPIEDILHTFTKHIANQIAAALPDKTGKILITGGGAYNVFLIECIAAELPEMEVVIPHSKILEFKEAIIFGLLGVLKLREEINVLASVTGAMRDHSSGVIFR